MYNYIFEGIRISETFRMGFTPGFPAIRRRSMQTYIISEDYALYAFVFPSLFLVPISGNTFLRELVLFGRSSLTNSVMAD